jgi:hypothetical protein
MAEETERMLGYPVDVVDLGLKVADAIRLGLHQETYSRTVALPEWMVPAPGYRADDPDEDWDEDWRDLPGDWKLAESGGGWVYLSRDETRWFVGKSAKRERGRVVLYRDRDGKVEYRCTRVELNAMPVPVMVRFFEEQFVAVGVKKIVPPVEVIDRHATETYATAIKEWMTAKTAELLGLDQVTEALIADTVDSESRTPPAGSPLPTSETRPPTGGPPSKRRWTTGYADERSH